MAAHEKDENKLVLDSDVLLTHYRLQKVAEQQLDLERRKWLSSRASGRLGLAPRRRTKRRRCVKSLPR